MHRRTFLSGLAPGLAAMAGCTDGSAGPDGSTDDGAASDDQSTSSADDQSTSDGDDQSTSDADGTDGEELTTNFFYHEVLGTAGAGGETIVELSVTFLVPPEVERSDVVSRQLVLGAWQGDPDDSESATTFVHADAAGSGDHSYALHDDVDVERREPHEGWPAYEVVGPLGADGPGAGDNSDVAPLEPSDEADLGLLTDGGYGNWKTLSVPDSFALYEEGDEVRLLR